MDGMLSPAEWDAIAGEIPEAKPSNLNAMVTQAGLSIMLGMLAAAFTVGFLGGMLGPKDEQIRIGSPLSLGPIAAWTVAVWFGFRLLRRFI